MRSAIVGCGSISVVHTTALHNLESTELIAFADIKLERAQVYSEKYGGTAYSSFDEMLEKEEIDVLHICTPHYLHVPMAIKALNKGINVIMEKPPAISKEQLRELREVERRSSAKLGICFQNRYNSSVVAAKELIVSGKAGKVLGARAFVTWYRNESYYTQSGWRGSLETEGGGVLINQSIHTLDLLTYILGNPKAVEGHVCNHHLKGIIEVEDTAEAYISFDSCNAIFYATTAYCADSPVLIEFICENLTIQILEKELVCIYKDGRKETQTFCSIQTPGKNCWGNSHELLIEDFYTCLKENRKFRIDLEQGQIAFDLMMGIYASSKTNAPVLLPYII